MSLGFGMLSIAVNGYAVENELESGYGRLDVVIHPKDKTYGSYAAFFEVKRAGNENELEELTKEAFNQIRERKYYYAKMKEKGCRVKAFGIAFFGRRQLYQCRRKYACVLNNETAGSMKIIPSDFEVTRLFGCGGPEQIK